jgi:putative NADH-flavin reductase
MQVMKILLLGATGRTGKLVVNEVLQRGHELNCLVRDPQKIKSVHERLKVFQGSPEKKSDLEASIKNCEAIINVLNVSRNSDFPWSKLRTPPTFLSEVMKNVIELAENHSAKRIVVCSAWGAAETKKDLPSWFRWFIDNSNIGYTYRDHERQEKLLMSSRLLWTIVRPVGLTNFKKYQEIIETFNNKPKPRMTVNRISLARYLVEAISNESLVYKAPVISGR